MHKVRNTALVLLTMLLAISLAGCKTTLKQGSPEAAVQSLLELRSELTTDSAKYAALVATPMAEALASDSASRTSENAPIPQWNTPKRTEETTAAAKVSVTWKSDAKFANWAKVTVFSLENIGGRWVVVDANADNTSKDASATP